MRYAFLGVAIFSIANLARMLWTGRAYARHGGLIYTRQTAPRAFWFVAALNVAFFVIGLVTFLYMYRHSI